MIKESSNSVSAGNVLSGHKKMRGAGLEPARLKSRQLKQCVVVNSVEIALFLKVIVLPCDYVFCRSLGSLWTQDLWQNFDSPLQCLRGQMGVNLSHFYAAVPHHFGNCIKFHSFLHQVAGKSMP